MTLRATAFTDLVGCRLPIQQAGMGAISTPALAAAVARAGGLGMIGAAGQPAGNVSAQLQDAIALAGDGAHIGVNFLMPFLDPDALTAAAQAATIVEFFYGEPVGGVVAHVHEAGALASWQVGSLEEARKAVDEGCDLVVVQGREAGGHLRGTSPLLPLLREVRDAVDVPLVAAGGVGSGSAMAAALGAGADAVRLGTLLLATPEADVHPDYAAALVAATAEDTVVTDAFSLGWPDAPHRVLRRCVDASDIEQTPRSPVPPTRDFAGDVGTAALYAGTSVRHVTAVRPAAAVIGDLVREAEAVLRAAGDQ
ncbi:MAG: NAD(P)H-dependent flavin oxidoreductase [Acidimicrobiia bacterium]